MTAVIAQPLNFVPKAIAQFEVFARTAKPASQVGFRYLLGKLRQAQVFLLPDHGQLLDRSKPRPAVSGLLFRPPFPVVALEYQSPAQTARRGDPFPMSAAPRRIALAWEWSNDLPPELARGVPPLDGGVVIASIAYFDEQKAWMPICGAMHLPYEDFAVEAGAGRAAGEVITGYRGTLIPILPEALADLAHAVGHLRFYDIMGIDTQDEVNAYLDLCFALGCGNVGTEHHKAPSRLNAARLKAGKVPLFDFHVLTLAGGDGNAGEALGEAREGPRAHLRRGHIRHLRHLGPNRITWVNASMVRGRGGFVDKAYQLRSAA